MKATWQGPRLDRQAFNIHEAGGSTIYGRDTGSAPVVTLDVQAFSEANGQATRETQRAVRALAEGAEPKWGTTVIAQVNGQAAYGMSGDFVLAEPRRSVQVAETVSGLANAATAAAEKANAEAERTFGRFVERRSRRPRPTRRR